MSQKTTVLSLCDRSGNMVRPWAEAGYRCIAVDLNQPDPRTETVGDGTIEFVQADVQDYEPPDGEYRIGFAFPPCTDLAVSGARWFQDKGLSALADAIGTVAACEEMLTELGCPWMLENPVSTLSTHWRSPDYKFDPFEFQGYTDADEAYTKETWLWTGGQFWMPVPDSDVDRADADDRIHTMSPGDDRGDKRAATPTGFARAVVLANEEPELYARVNSGTKQTELPEAYAGP